MEAAAARENLVVAGPAGVAAAEVIRGATKRSGPPMVICRGIRDRVAPR